MAAKLTTEDVGKLGPAAQSQLRAMQPNERPKPKRRRRNAEELRIARARASREEAKTGAFTEDRRRRASEREGAARQRAFAGEQRRQASVKRKLAAQSARRDNERAAVRQRRIGAVRGGAVRLGRGTARSAQRVPGNVSVSGLFGVLTGAALVGALVFRAQTITGLLGHMVSYWQKVIGLGKAGA